MYTNYFDRSYELIEKVELAMHCYLKAAAPVVLVNLGFNYEATATMHQPTNSADQQRAECRCTRFQRKITIRGGVIAIKTRPIRAPPCTIPDLTGIGFSQFRDLWGPKMRQ